MAIAAPIPAQEEEEIQEDARRGAASFRFFVRAAWSVLEPGTRLVWNWHMDAVCLHLQAVYNREILRLLVNIQPGVAKSTIFSVMWPAWCWMQDASIRWLCASHSMDNAIRDNKNCRDLIQSTWYQARWGHLFEMKGDQNVKTYFENDHRGYRMAVAVRSSGTGKRGTHLLIDDPNNAMAGQADIEAVKTWFGRTWVPRLNDQKTGAMVVVGQRMGENDLSSHILGLGGWEHLNLPTEYVPGRKCVTKIWEDPRTEEGQLLAPEQFPPESVEKVKRSVGPVVYEAQYQQNPQGASGKPYMPEFQRYFTIDYLIQSYLLETPRGRVVVPIADCWNFCAIDPAISLKQTADFFVMASYAVTPYKDTLLLDIFRGHYTHPEQKEHLVLYHQRFGFLLVAVESVAYQAALIQTGLAEGVPCVPFTVHQDKLLRSGTASIWDRAGKSYTLKDAPWLFEYQTEIFAFPHGAKDDQADTKSMSAIVVCTMKTPGVLDLNSDKEAPDTALSIEQILEAEAITEEQQRQAEEAAKAYEEEFTHKGGLLLNPFDWAESHEIGGDWS